MISEPSFRFSRLYGAIQALQLVFFIVFTRLLHIQLRKEGSEASSHCIVLYRSSFKTTSPRIGPGLFLFSRAAGLFFCYIISYSALSGPLVGTVWIDDIRKDVRGVVCIYFFSLF